MTWDQFCSLSEYDQLWLRLAQHRLREEPHATAKRREYWRCLIREIRARAEHRRRAA